MTRLGIFLRSLGKSSIIGLACAAAWLLLDAAWFAVTQDPDVISSPIDTFGAAACGALAVYLMRDLP
jgi:hypothetical protein